MKVNENLRNAIFEVIANQVEANDPPETALTLERLMNEGFPVRLVLKTTSPPRRVRAPAARP